MNKKYNFVYQTTNITNNKIYIGIHSTNNLDDGYLGSGKRLNDSIKCHGVEKFKRVILEYFETREECYKREAELVTTAFINRDDVYNITEGGYGVITHSKEGLQKLSNFAKERAIMRNIDGDIKRVKINSDEYNDMIGHTTGMVCAKDLSGKEIFVSQIEFNTNEELVGRTKGKISVIDKVSNKIMMIDKCNYDINTFETFTTGKVTVKDKDGCTFQVSKNDHRLTSGKLVGVMRGIKTGKQKNKRSTVKCPYCDKVGDISNMKRWHFEKCKYKNS